jgi:hypothetical protein
LVRTLYKALVCSARTFEHEPALNALIYRRTAPRAAPSTASDEDEDADTTPAETTPTTPMDEVYDEFLGSKQLRFFHPDVSRRTVLEVVRQRFQQPLPSSPEAPPSSSYTYHPFPRILQMNHLLDQEREQRLDLGFKVIQVLDEAIALGRQLGLLKGTRQA